MSKRRFLKNIITKELLEQEYIINKKKMREIAEELQCSLCTISVNIKKYGLKPSIDNKYIGKKYGKLTILKKYGLDDYSHVIWLCECECGKQIIVRGYALTTKNTGSCGCSSRKKGKNHKNFTGYEEIPGRFWTTYKISAKERKLEFSITIQEAWNLFLKQDRKCALTGLDINFHLTSRNQFLTTASLDRIDSTKGYTTYNIQWVHKKLNRIKWNIPNDEFIQICKLVAKNNK